MTTVPGPQRDLHIHRLRESLGQIPEWREAAAAQPAPPLTRSRHPGHALDSSTDRARRGEERYIVVRFGVSGERVERFQDAPHESRGGGVVRPKGVAKTLGTEDLTG